MRTLRDRRGAIAAASAVLMIVIVGFAGLAVDVTRIWMVNARLKTAIDAASLVAARQITRPEAERNAQVQAVYWANFSQNGRNYTYMGATVDDAVITPVPGQETRRIQVSGTAVVPTTLFSIIQRRNTTVMDSAIAERQGTGLELAVVIDQTSSMLAAAPGFTSKLDAAQRATLALLEILYGEGNTTQRNLWVSVVPFARTINIGTENVGVLHQTNLHSDWNVSNWYGCVEARMSGNNDITDLGPDDPGIGANDPGGRLRPYLDASTYRRVGWATTTPSNAIATHARNETRWNTGVNVPGHPVPQYSGAGACSANDAESYPAINVTLLSNPAGSGSSGNATQTYSMRFCRGDNDWGNPNGLATTTSNLSRFNPEYAYLVGQGLSGTGYLPTSAAGPNRLCALTPMLPLTANRTTVEARVQAMTAPTRSAGTSVVTGLQGGWYALSPRWQGHWSGISSSAELGALPLAYNTRNMVKAMVILTDGDNNWQAAYCPPGSPCRTGSNNYTVRGSPSGTELLYNAYRRAANWNSTFPGNQISPVTQTNADNRLDGRTAAICTAIKNSGIILYVVGFEIANSTHREMLRTCATSRNEPHFIEARNASDLADAFETIANQLASLRLVQ